MILFSAEYKLKTRSRYGRLTDSVKIVFINTYNEWRMHFLASKYSLKVLDGDIGKV